MLGERSLPGWGDASYHLPGPIPLVFWVHRESSVSGVPRVSSVQLISDCNPPGRCQPSRIQGRLGQQSGACSQFGRGCCLWGGDCPFLVLALAHLPPCLQKKMGQPKAGQLSCGISSILCSVSRLAVLQVRAFHREVVSLSLFSLFSLLSCLSLLSLSLAITLFALLFHISSLRLPSGHTCSVPTLNSAAPTLLVADTSIWATSPLGVAVRHVICGFYLFIFPPSYVAL